MPIALAIKKWMNLNQRKIVWSLGSLFLIHLLIIVCSGLCFRAKKSAMIIVLGNKVELSGVPSKRLQYRLDKSYDLYQAGMGQKIIVSGGIGKEGFDEAEIMANYLIEKGVSSEKIIEDNKGTTTYKSAQNCQKILRDNNAESIIVVSQYFHLLRSKIAFEKMGIKKVSLEASDWFIEWRDLYSIPREILGVYYYLVRSYD